MSCPDCFKGSVHQHGTPTGTFENLHGYRTYVAGKSDTVTSPTRSTIIYLPDAFSLKLINNQLLADRYARETGCRVLVPDIIPGGGIEVITMTHMEAFMKPAGLNPFNWVRKAILFAKLMYYALPFMLFSRGPRTYPSVLKYTRAVRADLSPTAKLGVCGFCWGGYGATRLCTEIVTSTSTSTSTNTNTPSSGAATGNTRKLIDASFTAHPSFLKNPDMIVEAVDSDVPYSCAVAGKDFMFTPAMAHEAEAALKQRFDINGDTNTDPTTQQQDKKKRRDFEIVVYKDCDHGFAVRAKSEKKEEMEGSENAARQAVDWFKRFLT